MASSSLAPHTTPQALSYADRAKKAQNIKSSNSLQPPRAVHTPLPPNASPTTSRSIKSSPAISKSSSMSSTAADTSTVVLTTSPFQPGPSSSPVSERQVNGSSSASTEPDAIISTAINSQQPPSKASTANFWNLRREKQAAQSPQPSSTQSSSSSPHSVSPNPQSQRSKDSSTLQPSSASYNDSDALEPDPFVVRPPPRPPRVYPAPTVPPLLHDPEAWPAVGQAPSASQLTPPPPAAVAVETYDQDSTETGTGAGLSKQSEKSKWVSLPVQADEAASDKGHRHNPRRGFQNTQVHPSRNNSQAQTRTPSGRTSSTHSVSQSRVNSRTNSAHSSPHLSRSRRLPSDDPTNPLNGGTSSRSSGRNSPRPHPFTHRGPTLSVDPNLAPPIATPMPMYGPPTATTINGTTYFPQPSPIHLPLTVPQDPLQYPHSASGHSPLQPPYMNYPSPLGNSTPPHLPQPFTAPPYPLYPPYAPYDYNNNIHPPYPHWYPQEGHLDSTPFPHPQYPYPIHELQPNPPPVGGVPSSASFTDQQHALGPAYDGFRVDPSRRRGQQPGQPFVFGSIDAADPLAVAFVQPLTSNTKGLTFSVGIGASLRLKSRTQKRWVPNIPLGESVWTSRQRKGAISVQEVQWEFGAMNQHAGFQAGVETKGPPRVLSPMTLPVRSPEVSGERVLFVPSSISNGGLYPQNPNPPYAHHPHAEGPGDWDSRNLRPGFPGAFPHPEGIDGVPEMVPSQSDAQLEPDLGRKDDRMGPRDDNFARSRRGGSYGGFDRGGFGRRGRGGYSRGFGRGVRGGYQTPQHQRQPFNVTPPPHYQPLVVGDIPNPNGYYPPPPSHQALPGYPIPHGYDGFGVAPPPAIPAPPAAQNASAAPFPAPRTALVFPLDPLRWFLLGQLEYYLSSQNLAADFFLRQRMDSRGWITISLLASFNRIKQLTVDMQLIRDVLGLSTEVEVKGDWVRTKDWAQYILPDAAKSTIEPEGSGIDDSSSSAGGVYPIVRDSSHGIHGRSGAEGDDDDDDEEEDVVFVMGDG